MQDRLKALPALTLAPLADYYGEMAEDCAAVERIKSRRQERRAYHERRAAILQTADLVRGRLLSMEADAAMRAVSDETGISFEAVLATYRHDQKMPLTAIRRDPLAERPWMAKRANDDENCGDGGRRSGRSAQLVRVLAKLWES